MGKQILSTHNLALLQTCSGLKMSCMDGRIFQMLHALRFRSANLLGVDVSACMEPRKTSLEPTALAVQARGAESGRNRHF